MTRHSMRYPFWVTVVSVLGFCGAFWGLVLWGVSVLFTHAPAPPHDVYALQFVAGANVYTIDHDLTQDDCLNEVEQSPRLAAVRCVVTGRTN